MRAHRGHAGINGVASAATLLLYAFGAHSAPVAHDLQHQAPLEPHVAEAQTLPFSGVVTDPNTTLLPGSADGAQPLSRKVAHATRLYEFVDSDGDGEKEINNLLDDNIDYVEPQQQASTPQQQRMHEMHANEMASHTARVRLGFPSYVVPASPTAHVDRYALRQPKSAEERRPRCRS